MSPKFDVSLTLPGKILIHGKNSNYCFSQIVCRPHINLDFREVLPTPTRIMAAYRNKFHALSEPQTQTHSYTHSHQLSAASIEFTCSVTTANRFLYYTHSCMSFKASIYGTRDNVSPDGFTRLPVWDYIAITEVLLVIRLVKYGWRNVYMRYIWIARVLRLLSLHSNDRTLDGFNA